MTKKTHMYATSFLEYFSRVSSGKEANLSASLSRFSRRLGNCSGRSKVRKRYNDAGSAMFRLRRSKRALTLDDDYTQGILAIPERLFNLLLQASWSIDKVVVGDANGRHDYEFQADSLVVSRVEELKEVGLRYIERTDTDVHLVTMCYNPLKSVSYLFSILDDAVSRQAGKEHWRAGKSDIPVA